ncbi:RICIN domain-containing protein [Streptomyces sp. NBC_00365]|uniref:RICIN domain-containing protein n=1 Tax=Streptomyces sp. NBC_00365 TaxID=2975726 RepID=UPI0022506FC7|nr:RICIN domain-containing protein [Streptomyces sp. NBC_00365]MCX5090716.1 RICIN domain-containing protein [Streptomyces sp. NBC_00365]
MAQVDAGASDARLTELLGADTPSAYPALQELRERHRPSVLAYARLCTRSESAARQLAAQAFTLAAQETARGSDPSVPWRHRLLLLAGRVAASWARDERAAGLDPGLLLVLSTAGPGGPVPPMLAPFRSLPSRAQGLLWYGVVDEEPADRAAVLLGLTHEDVTYGVQPALQALGQACLKSRLAASDDPRCGDFRRLIEESLRPDNPRSSPDLHAHMAHCAHCTTAYEELSALRDHPRGALAEGLLPWAGTAYVMSETGEPRPGVPASSGPWPPSRRLVVTSAAALGVALVPLLFVVLSSGRSPSQDTAGSVTTPSVVPRVTVTATVSATPSPPAPRPSATSESPSSNSPKPSPSPSRSASPRPSPTPTPAYPPGGSYAQVVNIASGLCLDIRDGDLTQGTDVVTAPCTSARTQRWRVDSGRGVLQSYADSDLCLDSRGSVDNGVGIWDCGSIDGSHGQNLRFTVDDNGVIRPSIAVETAVTPSGGDGLSLLPLNGGASQRWRAGAS